MVILQSLIKQHNTKVLTDAKKLTRLPDLRTIAPWPVSA